MGAGHDERHTADDLRQVICGGVAQAWALTPSCAITPGLYDRPRPGARPPLDDTQMARLRQLMVDGPDVQKMGLSVPDCSGKVWPG